MQRPGWYDDCKKAVEEINEARKKMISRATISNTEEFIKIGDRICRSLELARKWIIELEEECNDQEGRKFYKRVQELIRLSTTSVAIKKEIL